MIRRKLALAIAGAILGTSILAASVYARPLGTVDGLPFFGQPYPYGYVYHRPPAECYDVQLVDTPVGPRYQVSWICDGKAPVTARY
jgi:hypothetical protein